MPLRDDWAASAELIRRIDQSISSVAFSIDVLLVDDGSQTFESSVFPLSFLTVRSISILRLRRNVGHQRAIAIGLMHIKETISSDAIVVMDADGEDTPEGLGQLLNAYFGKDGVMAVFAERTRRLESFLFRSFYLFYKVLHWAFTGVTVRVGNFSVLPPRYLSALSVMPELWSHYAAAVFRSRLPLITITIPRGLRIAGKSKMNFVALVSHGLSAIAVFADVVGRATFDRVVGRNPSGGNRHCCSHCNPTLYRLGDTRVGNVRNGFARDHLDPIHNNCCELYVHCTFKPHQSQLFAGSRLRPIHR